MKRCFKCGEDKERSEFYSHPQMGDGLLGKCKECAKIDVRVDRMNNPLVRKYDRERSSLPHRVALRVKVTTRWRMEHRDRARAQVAANRASSGGVIKRPPLCEGCSTEQKLQKHHRDYSRPLSVAWLCKPCHAVADKVRRCFEATDQWQA